MNLEFYIEKLSQNQIKNILMSFDNMFVPSLSSVIDIPIYANKLALNAKFATCRYNSLIIGIIAFYSNNITKQIYISYVCVDCLYQGKGIAKILFKFLMDNVSNDYKEIVLEVRKNNLEAFNLYLKLGFTVKECKDEKYLMSKILL